MLINYQNMLIKIEKLADNSVENIMKLAKRSDKRLQQELHYVQQYMEIAFKQNDGDSFHYWERYEWQIIEARVEKLERRDAKIALKMSQTSV